MKKAQMEMVGLVFIVMIIVVAIVLYLRFSVSTGPQISSTEVQSLTSFLIALKETTIPSCGLSVERVVAGCIQNEVLCTSRNPCKEAEDAMSEIAEEFLPRQGYRYNLSVANTGIQVIDDCRSADRSVALRAAPRVPIVYSGGAQEQMVLAICR